MLLACVMSRYQPFFLFSEVYPPLPLPCQKMNPIKSANLLHPHNNIPDILHTFFRTTSHTQQKALEVPLLPVPLQDEADSDY